MRSFAKLALFCSYVEEFRPPMFSTRPVKFDTDGRKWQRKQMGHFARFIFFYRPNLA